DKCYRAEILLGRRTDTDDTEGSILEEKELDASITEALIKEKLAGFVGKLIKIPPVYSAIKQGGRKLYEMARKGEAPRE
ncbi:MAG TPA: tRNA pseudouridine(55) synthase TruB, partial [Candidatus Melainabacteria bacterium]|nr:tRNA pseudouridine(55) synthase TruB [Candidatus Melainabacteria bacterium]